MSIPPRASKRSHGDRMLSHKAVARMAVSIVTTALANGERSLTDSRWSRLLRTLRWTSAPGIGPNGVSNSSFCHFPSAPMRSEEHTSELQSQFHLVCRLLLEKKKSSIYKRVYSVMRPPS